MTRSQMDPPPPYENLWPSEILCKHDELVRLYRHCVGVYLGQVHHNNDVLLVLGVSDGDDLLQCVLRERKTFPDFVLREFAESSNPGHLCDKMRAEMRKCTTVVMVDVVD